MRQLNRHGLTKGIVTVLVVCVGTAGCATRPQADNQTNAQGQAEDECNPLVLGIAGAVLGGVLARGKNRAKGAALGAGLASLACVAWNYNSRQTIRQQTGASYPLEVQLRVMRRAWTLAGGSRLEINWC
mgnify:CR=1 FL=1